MERGGDPEWREARGRQGHGYLGKPRVKSSGRTQTLKWGIPTADVVAWGLERKGLARPGAMITRELPKTEDLSIAGGATMRASRTPSGSMP